MLADQDASESLYGELEQAKARIAQLEAELIRIRQTGTETRVLDAEVLHGISDAVMALDSDLRLEWANAEAERLLQMPGPLAMVGREIEDVFPAWAGDAMERTCRSVRRDQKPAEVEIPCAPLNAWYSTKIYPARAGGLVIVWRDISDHKRLLADQQRQARVLEQVHDSIISTNLDGIITRWNHGAAAMFGYSDNEALGQHVSMLYFEEDRPNVFPLVLEPLLRDGKREVELRNRRKCGEECYIRLSLSLLRDEQNQAYAMLGVAIDITAQRRAEQALRDSEELYRRLVDTMPQIVYRASADGKTQMIGPRWEDYSGVSADQCLDMNWLDWIHPDDVPGLVEGWKHSLTTGNAFERIYRVRNAARVYRWHLSRSLPVRGVDGGISQWVGVLTDIHDHKIAEDKLRLNEERMRVAQEVAGFGHFELNLRTGEFITSDALRRLFGSQSAEPITFLDKLSRIHPDDRPGVEAAIEEARNGIAPKVSVSYRAIPPDGTVCWRLLEARVFADPDGDLSRLIGVIADITPHKNAADALRLDAERRQLREIFRSLTEAVIILSSDGKVLAMNPAALRMHELDPDGALPPDIDEIAKSFGTKHLDGSPFPVEDWPASKALRGEVVTGIELMATNLRTGSTWAASYGGAPVFDEHGKVTMAVISIRDITAQRSASEEIRQANQALHGLTGQLLRLQDDERRRIARELHDGTVQVLSAAIMNLHMLEDTSLLDRHGDEKRLLEKAMNLAQQGAKELRTMSYLLHPPALDELGFVPALLSWVDGFSERSGMAADITLPRETIRFSPEIERALFRITQEALGNVHRHSRCRNTSIKLEVGAHSVCLEIADDGIGFNSAVSAGTRAGVGLLGMRERSMQLGGTFSVESRPGRTVVRAEIPLPPKHE